MGIRNLARLGRFLPDWLVQTSPAYQASQTELETTIQNYLLRRYEQTQTIATLQRELKELPKTAKAGVIAEYEARITKLLEKHTRQTAAYLGSITQLNELRRTTALRLATEIAERQTLVKIAVEAALKDRETVDAEKHAALVRQCELQIGNIRYKQEENRRLKERYATTTLRLLEGTNEDFAQTPGLFLDLSFCPQYATPGLYDAFNITEEQLRETHPHGVLNLLDASSRHKVLEYVQGRRRFAPRIKATIEGKEYDLLFKATPFPDATKPGEEPRIIGTFVHLRDMDASLLERIKDRGNMKTLATLVDNIATALQKEFASPLEPQT